MMSALSGHELRTAVETDLLELDPSLFVMRWLLDRTPYVFGTDARRWAEWKLHFASRLGVDACSIHMIGSAGVGVSLNPDKNLSLYHDNSDVDIAVVSPFHFEHAWRTIREFPRGRGRLTSNARYALKTHQESYVFWGTIATDRILGLMPFGKAWLDVLAEFSSLPPLEGRALAIRLYKDHDSLIGYHSNNVRKLRMRLLSPPDEAERSEVATEE